jgi:hypothetical protein
MDKHSSLFLRIVIHKDFVILSERLVDLLTYEQGLHFQGLELTRKKLAYFFIPMTPNATFRRVDYASTESLHMAPQAAQGQQPTLDEGSEVSLLFSFLAFNKSFHVCSHLQTIDI